MGKNTENIYYLGECMKKLPNNLKHFNLDLTMNKLGEKNNMKHLVCVLKYLPKNLHHLQINLNWNSLGEFSETIKKLTDGIK